MKKRKITTFGIRIKNALVDLNMTQKELAGKIGTSDVYLSMILYGERSGVKYIDGIKTILKIDDS